MSAPLRALCVLPRQPGMPCPSPLTWRLLHTLGLPLSVTALGLLPSLETQAPRQAPQGKGTASVSESQRLPCAWPRMFVE